MRVLILHNTYQQPGGEDAACIAEAQLLRDAGHKVHVATIANSELHGAKEKVNTFLRAPYDASRKRWVDELLESTGAEIVHVHNFFPRLTPAVHEAVFARAVPLVQTLHNYRLLCANGLFLRDGGVCEK